MVINNKTYLPDTLLQHQLSSLFWGLRGTWNVKWISFRSQKETIIITKVKQVIGTRV